MTVGEQVSDRQVVVVGAGPSGVAAALSLRDRGLRPLLIDRADQVGSSWRGRYDRLKLNTGRRTSHMPSRPYAEGTAVFPTRDQVVDHLERHAHEDGIDLRLGTTLTRIDPYADGWRLSTSTGVITTRQVVIATGYEHTPKVPTWPGTRQEPDEAKSRRVAERVEEELALAPSLTL
jgi:cation diffusion facilitator CzcD-associated flavoprotein CzcO